MLAAIGDSLSDLASSNDREDGEDEDDEETEQGELIKDDEPGWVMGTITKMVQQHKERLWQKEIKLNELTEPGWEDATDNFRERDKKYGTSELRVVAVVQRQTNEDAPVPPPTPFGEPLESLGSVHLIAQSPEWTSRPGGSHIRLRSVKPQSKWSIPSGESAAEPDLSMLLKAKPVEPVRLLPCI